MWVFGKLNAWKPLPHAGTISDCRNRKWSQTHFWWLWTCYWSYDCLTGSDWKKTESSANRKTEVQLCFISSCASLWLADQFLQFSFQTSCPHVSTCNWMFVKHSVLLELDLLHLKLLDGVSVVPQQNSACRLFFLSWLFKLFFSSFQSVWSSETRRKTHSVNLSMHWAAKEPQELVNIRKTSLPKTPDTFYINWCLM